MKHRRRNTARRVLWVLRAFGSATDRALEKALASLDDLPPSTVRGARKRLERAGLVAPAGLTLDGRKKWALAHRTPADPPANKGESVC